ncbi:bifunctional indole-3-glycerol-phosphate synthase TrpC/phosphoribosylanthranilate isomerase TrpF [Colwellia sp. E2M01]|uniref:bifunctional indole-3-glycerol-phosphate synthase TrpC/phosphoribosylanthranilate isomerase TrpF n=1 Tax=Colwellia sp. E2M01 TaxID=2841561 RepID=UPI001C07F46C|nr:bifunctional indole-3-glycerol-phosphate synthase TrpC/phosphoribosylanthranilate isomerase TrpF [Colwellia sp. E2M01]MBU2871561.1 bifunctional indole-3-glycerol-phosphate synthase TrpC/phosphoribosylanthranilate isomerase TrpF [Colwellia sp. E2M01]
MTTNTQTANAPKEKNILERIVDDKRVEIDALKISKPLETFINDLVPTTKDMYAALTRTEDKPYAGFILECKKASPSKGLIRPDFDVKGICQIYDNYAAAISVLTDKKYFQGDFEYLRTVTESVKCPVLNKDFFIDTYQVHLARHYGADAILLMLSVLSDEEYKELAAVAEQYNLAILTEISTEDERDRAIALNAKMIGINNRNLRDLSTDLIRTFEYAPTLPDDRIIISESGIYNNAQVRELAPAVDGFLVGSSLMDPKNNVYQDIDLACRKLIFGNNKVCGLTDAKYANAAAQAGARFGGLIFAEKSPRYVTKEQAKNIINAEAKLEYVGVFVNENRDTIIDLVKTLKLNAVQLHGSEDAQYISALTQELSDNGCDFCQIWQASPVAQSVPLLNPAVTHHVLDGKSPGSGESFDWQVLTESEQDLSKSFLAGGLNNNNIGQAIEQLTDVDLFGLDLNSGVEDSPGIKSSEKLNQVFSQIRNY